MRFYLKITEGKLAISSLFEINLWIFQPDVSEQKLLIRSFSEVVQHGYYFPLFSGDSNILYFFDCHCYCPRYQCILCLVALSEALSVCSLLYTTDAAYE